MSEQHPPDVRALPRRLSQVCWVVAPFIVLMFIALSFGLTGRTEGGGMFSTGDQYAMVGLGILLAAGVLWFTRPRVYADTKGVRIRNMFGSYNLPWQVVTAVRFDEGSPWAALDLADDDQVAVMAIQRQDKDRAVAAVRGLRALLADSQTGAEGTD
ncbi:PH domain-containing protein [Fodinicola feengrottensis]|uniref:Low molecular weight protein antigen 6 PH domain-containing protein n=1 Tax=Fodinicola feengrottensis TaxID=435914 RepID=A0ABN2H9W0_9ACTN|nr:PH domain-containing protein [Fodinicola feengrottensis]